MSPRTVYFLLCTFYSTVSFYYIATTLKSQIDQVILYFLLRLTCFLNSSFITSFPLEESISSSLSFPTLTIWQTLMNALPMARVTTPAVPPEIAAPATCLLYTSHRSRRQHRKSSRSRNPLPRSRNSRLCPASALAATSPSRGSR